MSDNDTKRPYSATVVDGVEKAAARAMLHAVGFDASDFKRAQVGGSGFRPAPTTVR